MRRETDNYKKSLSALRACISSPLPFFLLRQRSEMKLKLIYHDDELCSYYIS